MSRDYDDPFAMPWARAHQCRQCKRIFTLPVRSTRSTCPYAICDGAALDPLPSTRRYGREVYRWMPHLGGWVYRGMRVQAR